MRAPDLRFGGVGVAGLEPSSRTAGRSVDGSHFRTSWAVGGHIETVPVDAVAVLRCCTAEVVRWSKLASSTSGAEWQCFVQFWPPWGVGRVSKAFSKVQPVIDLGEEVR